jgi:VanZ family protein
VSKAGVFVKYWLLPLIWMVVIFSASGDSHSFQHSSRIIGPLLHWLFPHLSHEKVDVIVTAVRKCAHLTEYAVLAFLFWRALWRPVRRDPRPWSWRHAGAAILLVAFYASTDEFHQRGSGHAFALGDLAVASFTKKTARHHRHLKHATPRSADFQVCCIAGFQTRVAPWSSVALPIWKSAIQQVWKPALQAQSGVSVNIA